MRMWGVEGLGLAGTLGGTLPCMLALVLINVVAFITRVLNSKRVVFPRVTTLTVNCVIARGRN